MNKFENNEVKKQFKRSIKIVGSGICLGETRVSSIDIDNELSLPHGTILKHTGVHYRYRQLDRNTPKMAAKAISNSLDNAKWKLTEIDAIISVSSIPHTLIPCNAIHIQKELGLGLSGITCFDINATCLGFFMALDFVALKISSGLWNKVVIVSSESGHAFLNKSNIESYGLFGDAAVAICVEKGDHQSFMYTSRFESYGEYEDLCKLSGGGVFLPANEINDNNSEQYSFEMHGPQIFKHSSYLLNDFCDRLFKSINEDIMQAPKDFSDIDLVIPHQASPLAMEIIRRKLNVPSKKWMKIIENYGNCVSASVPMALHFALIEGRCMSKENIFLIGTGAGLSIAGIILRV